MAYNKNLYSSSVSALDAGIIYDLNQQLMQDEINAGFKDGDIVVGLADNLASEQSQFSIGEFIERTTGGDASLSDGEGDLILIRGSKFHEGYYAQSVDMELTHASGSEITAMIDDAAFLSQMASSSGTFTTVFDGSSWSYSPDSYGITISGTPIENDTIIVTYQKEIRGSITMSDPQTFVSTGWNLYNHALGYARVLKYHETYGFGIAGTYTALQFSSTIEGAKSSVTVTDGKFNITEDGYIWVTGGNNTNTAIWMTWSDWQTEPNGGVWESYTESEVDFSSVMSNYFPYGLMAVEGYRDEIDFSLKKATVNVGRLVYNSTNLELAKSYRTAIDYDENYIYYGLPESVVNDISLDNDYVAYDHGVEFFTGTEVAVYTQTLYGINLKNRLERDVLTISQQTLTESQKTQVHKNIGVDSMASIYIGSSEPVDSRINIWLDTDEPGMTGVSSVNGKTGTVVLNESDIDAAGGMSKWDLLWVNASPTSEFAEQTIPLNLSGYDAILCDFVATSGNHQMTGIYLIGNYYLCRYVTNSSSNVRWYGRNLTASTTGVEFGNASSFIQGTSGTTTINTTLMPSVIYGIKGLINS